MGADARSYVYLGIDFFDVFENKVEKEFYDLFDTKTGKKTGKQGVEETHFYVNRFNGKKYPTKTTDISDIINSKYIHSLDQETNDHVIGIKISEIREPNGGFETINLEKIENAKKELDRILIPHLLTGTGLIGKVEPKLIHNLYWSY